MDEQQNRFESMQLLADEAEAAVSSIQNTTKRHLGEVDNDSSVQAESFQRISQAAGTAVEALQHIADLARRSRSYQAQAHQDHSPDSPR